MHKLTICFFPKIVNLFFSITLKRFLVKSSGYTKVRKSAYTCGFHFHICNCTINIWHWTSHGHPFFHHEPH